MFDWFLRLEGGGPGKVHAHQPVTAVGAGAEHQIAVLEPVKSVFQKRCCDSGDVRSHQYHPARVAGKGGLKGLLHALAEIAVDLIPVVDIASTQPSGHLVFVPAVPVKHQATTQAMGATDCGGHRFLGEPAMQGRGPGRTQGGNQAGFGFARCWIAPENEQMILSVGWLHSYPYRI